MVTASDLREALRVWTRSAHRLLDAAPEQQALLRPGLTVGRYADVLARHAEAYARCESRIARLAGHRPAGLRPYHPRLPALQADLDALEPGRPRLDTDPDTEGELRDEARPRDAAEGEGRYLGLRYVLDGATQGARGIAPRLAELLPELRDGRFAFWRLQLEQAQAWPELTRVLAERPADGPLARAATEAALEAFAVFQAAFGVTGRGDRAIASGERAAEVGT